MLYLVVAATEAEQSELVLSDFWQKVFFAVLAAVLGFVTSYTLDRRKAKREPVKRLSYDLAVRSGISAIPKQLQQHVRILYQGEPVTQSLYEVECVFTNTGNRVIKNQYVRFEFPSGAKVLDVQVQAPPELGVEEDLSAHSDSQRRYVLRHLESDQSSRIVFILNSAAQPNPNLVPFNEEGDVALVPGTVARAAEDGEHLRPIVVLLLVAWFMPFINFFGFIDTFINFSINLVLLILALPHIAPVARLLTRLVLDRMGTEADTAPSTTTTNMAFHSEVRVDGDFAVGAIDAATIQDQIFNTVVRSDALADGSPAVGLSREVPAEAAITRDDAKAKSVSGGTDELHRNPAKAAVDAQSSLRAGSAEA